MIAVYSCFQLEILIKYEKRRFYMFKNEIQWTCNLINISPKKKFWVWELETQWAEPASLTFHSVFRKLYTEPSIAAS